MQCPGLSSLPLPAIYRGEPSPWLPRETSTRSEVLVLAGFSPSPIKTEPVSLFPSCQLKYSEVGFHLLLLLWSPLMRTHQVLTAPASMKARSDTFFRSRAQTGGWVERVASTMSSLSFYLLSSVSALIYEGKVLRTPAGAAGVCLCASPFL